jgi:hypothetical protein
LTTTLQIKAPNYLGLKVEAEIVVSELSQPELVRARVLESLRNFISPLALNESQEQADDLMGSTWEGWPFGRSLYVAEIFSLIQRVPGVKHVLDVTLHQRGVTPALEGLGDADGGEPSQDALAAVSQKVIHVPADTLLCSLEHDVKLVELGADHD